MTTIASAPASLAAGLRPLTADEQARLDWLRGQLRTSRADVSSATALGALVDASHAGWARSGATTPPDGMVAALAVGLGDVLVARAAGASWVLRTADGTSGPAVVDATGEAVVLPFEDLRSRWVEGRVGWLPGYVDAAAAHLGATRNVVPQPRTVTDTHGAPAAAPAPAPVPVPSAGPAAPLPSRSPAGGANAAPAGVGAPVRPASGATWQPTPAEQPSHDGQTLPLPRRHDPAPDAQAAQGGFGAMQVAAPVVPAAPAVGLPVAPAVGLPAAPAAGLPATPAAGAAPTLAAAHPTSPADLPTPPSPAVQDLVLRALEQGLERALAGGEGLPLAVVPHGERWAVQPFAGGADADARAWLAGSGAACGALAWLGELDGEPAVIAEASEAARPGLRVGHRFAPRAQPAAGRRSMRAHAAEPVGDLVLLAQSAPVV